MSTLSTEENLVMSSEDSSCPDESELELGLGLSFRGCGGAPKVHPAPTSQYARILTAKDFPSAVSSPPCTSSSVSSVSSSSSSVTRDNVKAGTPRDADTVTGVNGGSQVVGWPPIRAYRMNSLVNQTKTVAAGIFDSVTERSDSKHIVGSTNGNLDKSCTSVKAKGDARSSSFVKVNMDGVPIGRKVNLSAHSCYETLAQALEYMFSGPTAVVNPIRGDGHKETGSLKLLDGSSDFVLTYEDKEGDWMLVGDVPWGMFLGTVKRLRIMRFQEAKRGLGM